MNEDFQDDELICLKLITGETLIAKLIFMNHLTALIDSPFVILDTIQNEETDGRRVTLFDNWVEFSSTTSFDINMQHVVAYYPPSESLGEGYIRILNLQNQSQENDGQTYSESDEGAVELGSDFVEITPEKQSEKFSDDKLKPTHKLKKVIN